MKYLVVQGKSVTELSNRVEDLLKRGWECIGGVTASSSSHDPEMFYQAMIFRRSV